MANADLHLHTSASDGCLPPAEVVQRAKAGGMDIVSITDHDTSAGLREAMAEGEAAGLCVIPGIELSCGDGVEIHLLGYGINPDDPRLGGFLSGLIGERQKRIRAMLAKAKALSMPVDMERVQTRGGPFVGRVQLARAMVDLGYVESVRDAFSKYLKPGKPLYVERAPLPVTEGLRRLREACPLVSLAHPGRALLDEGQLLALLPEWIDAGLNALEAYHDSHSSEQAARYARLAKRYGLARTGGSDFHGGLEGARIGGHIPGWREMDADVADFMARLGSGRYIG